VAVTLGPAPVPSTLAVPFENGVSVKLGVAVEFLVAYSVCTTRMTVIVTVCVVVALEVDALAAASCTTFAAWTLPYSTAGACAMAKGWKIVAAARAVAERLRTRMWKRFRSGSWAEEWRSVGLDNRNALGPASRGRWMTLDWNAAKLSC